MFTKESKGILQLYFFYWKISLFSLFFICTTCLSQIQFFQAVYPISYSIRCSFPPTPTLEISKSYCFLIHSCHDSNKTISLFSFTFSLISVPFAPATPSWQSSFYLCFFLFFSLLSMLLVSLLLFPSHVFSWYFHLAFSTVHSWQ